jgi:drug/metabolite transporter (DMT)-like permease
MKPYLLTIFAMLAFAANSVLGRFALIADNNGASIDAASYTSIRLLSGAVMLAIIMLIRTREFKPSNINPISTLMLFTYAICFSFSYINIATGTGALILFGTVQLTMILFGLFKGEQPGHLAWMGIFFAFAGLVYLLLPGISAPPFFSALLMMIAGLAWGVYSIRGKGTGNPLITTSWNFIATLPLLLITMIIFHAGIFITQKGILLAILSGALASGLGYSIWYSALPYLSSTRAATVQLTVPVIASLGGVLFLSENLNLRLVVASIAILGGVYLSIKPVKS